MPPGAASAIGTAPQVPPGGASLRCCPVLPGRNAFVGSHDLPKAVGTNHPPPTLPTASLLLISSAAGEDREGTGGESATGKTPLPDGSTRSPTRTPPPAVSGTPSHDGRKAALDHDPNSHGYGRWGTIVPTLADETILPPELPILADQCSGVQCVIELSPSYECVYCSKVFGEV
jgi:hypothetical protein